VCALEFSPLLLLAKHTEPKTAYTLPLQIEIIGTNVSMLDKKSNFLIKNFRGRKEMTTKKSKKNRLTPKKDFKYRLKEVQKKNQNTNKRIETFSPISNEETSRN
jgi:hypothetical protein